MAKRSASSEDLFREIRTKTARKYEQGIKKHSLDSDEEDEVDDPNNVLNDDEFEGEEEGTSNQDGEQRMTAFNMQEEMELGHFDKQGHFIWKNEKEVRDNWLDNIDWQQIKSNSKFSTKEDKVKGLGDESDSEEEEEEKFDEIAVYEQIITYMKPRENINKTLRRLGGDLSKLSSVERLKRKKAGTLNVSKEVTDLTELANKILNTGNMDVYQETYEGITQKIENHKKKQKSTAGIVEAEFDMFSDAFEQNERDKLSSVEKPESKEADKDAPDSAQARNPNDIQWEFKRDLESETIEGPYDTLQMLKWVQEGNFKGGVWVRKHGETSNFYSSNRIDFDLYL